RTRHPPRGAAPTGRTDGTRDPAGYGRIPERYLTKAGRTLMLAPAPARPVVETLADLVRRVGSVPLERIPARPAPGTATEADVLACPRAEKRLYELVYGVLVEKPMGYYERSPAGVVRRSGRANRRGLHVP